MEQAEDQLLIVHEHDTDVKKMENPREKTAVLWGGENLLGSVVESLLDSRNMWRIVRISDDHDKSATIKNIKDLKPGVLIVYKREELVEVQLLIQLLGECPDLKIITVSPESNSVQIYNKQRVWIKNSGDFLSVLEG